MKATNLFARRASALAFGSLLAAAVSGPLFAQGANVCANADLITTVPSVTAFDTNSPSDTPGTPATSNAGSSCIAGGNVWFKFVPPTSGTYLITTCGSGYNTVLTAYSGQCGSLVEEVCNDNFCANQSGFQHGFYAGVDYYLSVGSNNLVNPVFGTGTITISEVTFPAASGSIANWNAAVAAGTPATLVDDAIPGPNTIDVGLRPNATGITYEFIAHGTNAGFSSQLLGSLGTGVGDAAGLKFEQFDDLGEFGVTEFGVADFAFGFPNTENVDLHIAFVVDVAANRTDLYVDGVARGSVLSAPVLEGIQGVGKLFGPAGSVRDTFDGVIRGLAIYDTQLTAGEIADHSNAYFGTGFSQNYCGPSAPNASGLSSEMRVVGSNIVANNDLTIRAANMPPATFGFFITSRTSGFVANPGGSFGNLCLSGSIGRYVGPGQVQNSGASTEISLDLDLGNTPQPLGFVSILPGETWFFQAWHRDVSAGTPGSNFTDGIEITFQ